MKIHNIILFDSKPYVEQGFKKYNLHRHNLTFIKEKLSKATVHRAKGHDVVCVFVNDTVDGDVIRALKDQGCKMIALRCTGHNNVDLKIAKALNMTITYVPKYSPYAVAEHAVLLMMACTRNLHRAHIMVQKGDFTVDSLMGRNIHGKTLGLIGAGAIGSIVVTIALGLGMHVRVYDPIPSKALEGKVHFGSLEEVFQSDYISLHCPLLPETKYIIRKETIAQMNDGVILINTGRGGLVNTKDLLEALDHGKVRAAGLDVYENESPYFFENFENKEIPDETLNKLRSHRDVILTPHQAFLTEEAVKDIIQTTYDTIERTLRGEITQNQLHI